MKRLVATLLLLCVCGCGVEAVGTAATAASMKKQEIEEGKKTMKRVDSSIEQMKLQSADRTRERADD